MENLFRKKSVFVLCAVICIALLMVLILLCRQTNETRMYFLTFESRRADKYVEEHIGQLLNSESKINPIDLDTVRVGAGVYVEDFDNKTSLPMFYYPVFINNSLSYVFRIYEDINGEYTSVLGLESVDAMSEPHHLSSVER